MTRAGIYCRVSTDRQETENQLRELREYAKRQGWEIVHEYVDQDVRGKDPHKPQLELLLLHAHQKRFDVVGFWSLDRLSRSGALDALGILNRLAASHVDYMSFKEPYLSSVGPFHDVVVSLIATIARFESERTSERIRAGLARAKAEGKKLGRPSREFPCPPAQLVKDRKRGLSWGRMGDKYGIPRSSARRLYQKALLETRKALRKGN